MQETQNCPTRGVWLKFVLSASSRFINKREAFQMCPSLHGFSRLLDADIELHRQILPEPPKWQGIEIAFVVYRGVLILISEIVLLWNRWIRS